MKELLLQITIGRNELRYRSVSIILDGNGILNLLSATANKKQCVKGIGGREKYGFKVVFFSFHFISIKATRKWI